MKKVSKAWRGLAGRALVAMTGKVRPDVPEPDRKYLVREMSDTIRKPTGEISDTSRALDLGMTYLQLSDKGREIFLHLLADEFDVDPSVVDAKMQAARDASEPEERVRAELELRQALIPPRVKLLKLFINLPEGFKFLINMRADLLPLAERDPACRKLDADLKGLLASAFDVSLLDLEQITWDSPASLLEKLIEYESVHEIRSWEDLKQRLDAADRRCFGFFHNKLPGEPLIFVEVALANGLIDNIQSLLKVEKREGDVDKTDTAIFYSISSTQNGLAGINLGHFLIKRVVERLSGEMKHLKHFATLSPVPRFMMWLENDFVDKEVDVLTLDERRAICKLGGRDTVREALASLLAGSWRDDADTVKQLKSPLLKLCAHYLVNVKRNGRAYDPVANLHLRNGAHLERINWLADTSENGLRQSAGLMVNYYYDLSRIERNHERYIAQGRVTASRDVRSLIKTKRAG
jgi:malonyl-CoA decarboxylase